MKPFTSQDTWWTWLQMDQGSKHRHVKLHGLGGLPTRSTQPERCSHSPEQHDLSVQIHRLKQPPMEKVWLPKLWASTIPSIWTYGRPNLGQGSRRYGPQNASCADKFVIKQIIFRGYFWILSSFSRKAMSTEVGSNFVAHNLDTNLHYLESGCGRYGAGKEGLQIKKIWTRLSLWKPSWLLSQGRSRAR
jgi:hypothetical protein